MAHPTAILGTYWCSSANIFDVFNIGGLCNVACLYSSKAF